MHLSNLFVSKRFYTKYPRKNLEKIQKYSEIHERPSKKKQIRFTFNASDKNCFRHFRQNTTNTILISKIKTRQHDKILQFNAFHNKSKLLHDISKLVCASLFFIFSIINQFIPNFGVKICVLFSPSFAG